MRNLGRWTTCGALDRAVKSGVRGTSLRCSSIAVPVIVIVRRKHPLVAQVSRGTSCLISRPTDGRSLNGGRTPCHPLGTGQRRRGLRSGFHVDRLRLPW